MSPATSPIENCNFGWGPNFVESPSYFVHMFSNLQRKFACCSNSCARSFTRTLVSIGFFLTQVKTVWIAAPSKIIILDGAETLSRTKIFSQFGSGPNRILCTSDQQWRISVPSITRLDRAPTFSNTHVLCFTCSTSASWTLHLFFATILTPSLWISVVCASLHVSKFNLT